MTTTAELPRWRLDTIFSDLDGPDFEQAVDELQGAIADLAAYMEERGIGESGSTDSRPGKVIEEFLSRIEYILVRQRDLSAYLHGRIDTDAFDDQARAKRSKLQPLGNKLSILFKRFSAWLGNVDLEAAVADSELARGHRYTLERYRKLSEHLMGQEAEELAAVLDNSGGSAWAQLHGALISRETVTAAIPGRDEAEYNVAELKQLQYEVDRSVRKAAYEAELELLSEHEVAYAAAMNSIKGQVGELAKRRGWESPLAESLFVNAMTRESLDALQQARRENFPVFRRYMKAKARFLGREKLAWYDLFAPIEVGKGRSFGWQEAREFVVENFSRYSDRLAGFASRAFDEAWMDAPSRKGKVNGAYCMSIPGRKESRILLNFGGRLDDVFTIAHELGHGFHNDCMFRFGRTNMQRTTPMTLAETASIFCETLILNAMLEEADDRSRLEILEQDFVGTNQIVVDIDSRFRFEAGVFERRAERELSVTEMKELMLEAQEATYGDALEANERHPLMWAHKGHYYSSNRSFYNYPYTFGLLFGMGLYRVFRDEPSGFQERYEKLLASTGMADAAVLGREFGIDIEDVDFWRGSLSVFADRVVEFERLVEKFVS
ncbi:MAG TPA: M3 family oligoendopeptidase [Trueperaceae bacterium]